MTLFIAKRRWHQILRIFKQCKPTHIHLFGSEARGRYCVLRAAGRQLKRIDKRAAPRRHDIARGKHTTTFAGRFLGVLFVHPPDKYWLTRQELTQIRRLVRRRGELVSGVLVHCSDHVTLYPVHFARTAATDMAMEYDGGFIYSQSWSALAILLPQGDERRGPAWW